MKTILLFSFLFTTSLLLAQTDANTYDATVPNHYFDFSLKLVKETPGFTPPVAARAFGYMGLTLYEAVQPGIATQESMDGSLYGLSNVTDPETGAEYHWPTVANNALALVLDTLFRTTTAANKDSLVNIRAHYNFLFSSQIDPQVFIDSKSLGEAIATDIIDYSRTDGGHKAFAENFPASFVPATGIDKWVPIGTQVALQPYWGTHRPFIEEDTIEAISPAPPEFSSVPGSIFYEYVYDVYETGLTLTPEQTTIALYWADGGGTVTPGGHSISMLNNILEDGSADLEIATIAYAKLGIALSDAFLACWKTKFIYNLCRPVTYINQYIDTSWNTLIGTPPFPEYPSGHSSQSGAMSEVMTDLFGSSFTFTDRTHDTLYGGPRTFESFEEAAQEAANSRLYGGIHFPFGNQAGLNLGAIVGENVNELFDALMVATENPADALANINIYPNPAQDFVVIKSEENLAGTAFQLLDINGKLVTTGKLVAGETKLNVSAMSAGIYLLRLADGYAYKVVKN
jgi:hypothetical protein